jgi:hypothetical protein
MAKIGELQIGKPVRYRFRTGSCLDGVIAGRRMNGLTEGEVDQDGIAYLSGKEPDRVKVYFQRIGVPPEYVSVSCDPEAIEPL